MRKGYENMKIYKYKKRGKTTQTIHKCYKEHQNFITYYQTLYSGMNKF